jgi:rhodanese-related sulfurtransferase
MSVQDINAKQLKALLKDSDKLEIIDVREKEEFDIIHIKGSKLIPMGELMQRINEIDWDKEVVFLCRTGARSKLAATLAGSGKPVKNLKYGIYECYLDKDCPDLEILKDEVNKYF